MGVWGVHFGKDPPRNGTGKGGTSLTRGKKKTGGTERGKAGDKGGGWKLANGHRTITKSPSVNSGLRQRSWVEMPHLLRRPNFTKKEEKKTQEGRKGRPEAKKGLPSCYRSGKKKGEYHPRKDKGGMVF